MARKTAKATKAMKNKQRTTTNQTKATSAQATTTAALADNAATQEQKALAGATATGTVSREELAKVFTTESVELQAGSDVFLLMSLGFKGYSQFQNAFLAKLEHEPEVAALFSALMGKHYENLKERQWQVSGNNKFVDFDWSTCVLLYLIQYFRGFPNIRSWAGILNNIEQRTHLQVILPQFLPVFQVGSYDQLFFQWFDFNEMRIKGPYVGGNSFEEAQQTLGKLFADLQMIQPWIRGNRFLYKCGLPPLVRSEQQLEFKQPRMSAFFFNLQALDEARKKLTSINVYDLGYQRDIWLEFRSACNLYDACKRLLLSFKRAGVDLNNTLLITSDESGKCVEKFTQVVTEFGAHYLMISAAPKGGRNPLAPQTWAKSFHYADCKCVCQILRDAQSQQLTLVEQKKLSELRKLEGEEPHVWVSSLDPEVGDNRQQLICAYELLMLNYIKMNVEVALPPSCSVEQLVGVEQAVVKVTGIEAIKQAFNNFVWQQLLAEGKVKKAKMDEAKLKTKFADLAFFLHYFALFSQPALKLMPQYLEQNLAGDFANRAESEE